MRLPPQVSAVRRETVSQIFHSNSSPGALPAVSTTGQSIRCWANDHQALICRDGQNRPKGMACCPSTVTNAVWQDGSCVCS